MSVKKFAAKAYARLAVKEMYRTGKRAKDCQEIILRDLISFAQDTYFGKAHHFSQINDYKFKVCQIISDLNDAYQNLVRKDSAA